jgi:3-hydroxymyristoyl/3-hydroxydecanoyl-(acyl carrier protein) dehydratase
MGKVECSFGLDHPAAEGHFPGNPIIPGAVLLSETLRAIEDDLGVSLSPFKIKAAKFFFPTRPGDRVAIEFTGSVPGHIRFAAAVQGKQVLAGQLECNGAPTAP